MKVAGGIRSMRAGSKTRAFQGRESPDAATLPPKEKPRGRERHPVQRITNQPISRVRVTVEHALTASKRGPVVANLSSSGRIVFHPQIVFENIISSS